MERINIRRIEVFQEGENVFTSNGISRVKVTKDGEIIAIEIPIKSTGISEIVDRFNKKAPQPPLMDVLVEPEDKLGRELNLTKKKWIKMPNFGDPDYIKAKEKHETDLGMKILMTGLAVELRDKEGNTVEDEEKKLEIMKSMGMTGDQFSKIVDDITSLTRWREEEQVQLLE